MRLRVVLQFEKHFEHFFKEVLLREKLQRAYGDRALYACDCAPDR